MLSHTKHLFLRQKPCSRIFKRDISVSHLKNKNAIVTGSTSGIGLSIARNLSKQGVNVVMNGFGNKEDILSLQTEIANTSHVKVKYHPADMTKPQEIRDLIQFTKQELGSVDILVNNAGVQYVSPVDDFPEDKWDLIMDINLNACFHSIKASLPHMREKGWGRIVNISSVHGLVASVNKSAYVAAKHGLVGLTKTVALETAGTGITINNICPGWVLTPLVQAQIELKAKENNISLDEARIALLSDKMPSKQFVESDSIGDMVVFFCLDSSSQITGTSLPVDGAWTSQ